MLALFIRSQARLTKTVKVLHRVAEAHAGSDRRFLPSHTRVSLSRGGNHKGRWALIRQRSGSLSTGSSAGRLSRRKRRLNVQSGHREVRRARPVKHQAMPRGEGNTEKVGMVTCCQEPRGRRFWIIAAAGSQRRVLYWSVKARELTGPTRSRRTGIFMCTRLKTWWLALEEGLVAWGSELPPSCCSEKEFSGKGCRPRVQLCHAEIFRDW